MFYNLPKPQYEGQEMYWEYSPLRWNNPKNTSSITQFRCRTVLTATLLKGYDHLKWVDEHGMARG